MRRLLSVSTLYLSLTTLRYSFPWCSIFGLDIDLIAKASALLNSNSQFLINEDSIPAADAMPRISRDDGFSLIIKSTARFCLFVYFNYDDCRSITVLFRIVHRAQWKKTPLDSMVRVIVGSTSNKDCAPGCRRCVSTLPGRRSQSNNQKHAQILFFRVFQLWRLPTNRGLVPFYPQCPMATKHPYFPFCPS